MYPARLEIVYSAFMRKVLALKKSKLIHSQLLALWARRMSPASLALIHGVSFDNPMRTLLPYPPVESLSAVTLKRRKEHISSFASSGTSLAGALFHGLNQAFWTH